MLTITLYAMKVSSTAVKAYKAIVIIAIVVLGSPVVQQFFIKLRDTIFPKPQLEEKQAYGE
jgi:simple sugar transport system permease protein